MTKDNLALSLARRQKRLKFWREEFSKLELPRDKSIEISALLNTYALLVAKVAKIANPEGSEDDLRAQSIERELTSLFEAARQETSDLNSPSGTPSLRT